MEPANPALQWVYYTRAIVYFDPASDSRSLVSSAAPLYVAACTSVYVPWGSCVPRFASARTLWLLKSTVRLSV
jgi:hypothetical protein